MAERGITIEFDDEALSRCTGERLAMLWHVAQASPAQHGDWEPGEITERIGQEIIRRWLGAAPIELYRHQRRDYYWCQLTRFAKYEPGGRADTPEFHKGQWVSREVDHTHGQDAPVPGGEGGG